MDPTSAAATENITVKAPAPAAEKSHLWAGDHFSFHDVLDAINPLQHIPIVGTIYRAVTGDTLGNAARVVGDGLYGGVIGVIAGLVDVSVLENTGKDIGGNVMAALGIDDKATQNAGANTLSDPSPTNSNTPVPTQKPAPPPIAPPVATQAAAPAPAPPTGIPLASTQPQLMPLSTGPKMMALNSQARGFPIDTSAEGILALRTTANSAPRPVPLNIPAGTLAPNQRIPLTGAEFAQRMSEGLDKYKALVTERQAASAGTSVNQVQ
ncbi:MAG: hypothetical protein JWO51_590 [Rhodospirillales bacterium]|nr:hypothetical protein [Rhodospirillales bacterium]